MSQTEEQTNANEHSHPIDTNRTFLDFITLAFKGFCMGIADVIPGVSGGTIAFMLGIYEDLIQAIKSFDLVLLRYLLTGKIKQALAYVPWRFLAALFFGIGSAIVLFSKVVSWLLQNHPVLINAFFFGLILMTVPIIARAVKQWDFAKAALFILSTVGTFFFVQLVPVSTPETWWFIFLSGAIAITAMILPGISGSFILLLMGKYQFILDAVHNHDFVTLGILMAGMAVGILSFVRVLEWLFRKAHDVTIAVLTGFVFGSLAKIWPWKEVLEAIVTSSGKIIPTNLKNILPPAIDAHFFFALALMLVGCFVAYLLHAIPAKHLKNA